MQRERSQTISVFPFTASHPTHSLTLQHPHNSPNTFDIHGSSVASSSRSPPPETLARLPALQTPNPSSSTTPSTHLIHLAPADSDSFRFLADLSEEPSSSVLFPVGPKLFSFPETLEASKTLPSIPDEYASNHHREDSIASQFEYVFGGPLNSLHSHRKSRTGTQVNPRYCDENDPLAQLSHNSSSILATAPAALDACSFAMSAAATAPASLIYPRYRGGPIKKKKKPLRQRIFSRRNKFVLLSSLVPLFSLVLVLIATYTSRVRYPKIQRMASQYVTIKDVYASYQIVDAPTQDADEYAYELEYPVFPPEKYFNLYNPIIKMEGALLKPRNPAASSYQQGRFSDSRYTTRIPFRKNDHVGPLVPITLSTPSFKKEDPFYYFEQSLANVLYLFENVAFEDPYFVYNEEHAASSSVIL